MAFDGGCRTLAGDACAGPTPRTNGTEPVTLVLIKATRDCGANGLWHFLNRCVTAAARAAAQRRAALAFVAHDGGPPGDPCRLAPLAERWRPFLEALFADGVYASLSCYRRARPSARTYREVAVVAATPASQTVPEYFRDVGFAAFGGPPPTDAVGAPRTVLHLRREDREGTLRAHRTLRNASVLEAAFRRAGFRVAHCCDFREPDCPGERILANAYDAPRETVRFELPSRSLASRVLSASIAKARAHSRRQLSQPFTLSASSKVEYR